MENVKKDILYLIMPAYNEEANIKTVAEEWHTVTEKYGEDSKLVIINDGSKDNTYKILKELECDLPNLIVLDKPNSGHGSTLLFGYKYALEKGAQYIFQTDSDGQTRPEEFEEFWNKRGSDSAVIGYRNHRKDGISRIFVTKVLKFTLRIIFGVSVTDANTPFRLMQRNILEKYMDDIPKDFNLTNVLLTVFFIKGNEAVEFIPITFRPRQGGVNSINLKRIFKIGIQAVKDFKQINAIWNEKHRKK